MAPLFHSYDIENRFPLSGINGVLEPSIRAGHQTTSVRNRRSEAARTTQFSSLACRIKCSAECGRRDKTAPFLTHCIAASYAQLGDGAALAVCLKCVAALVPSRQSKSRPLCLRRLPIAVVPCSIPYCTSRRLNFDP